MKMKEVETRTGLDRKNIRYYESEELLTPRRDEGNRYRNYSVEDIDRLLKIKLLRQLGIPIKDIHGYFEGSVGLGEVMARRRSQIDQELEQLKKMGQLCDRLEEQEDLTPVDVEQCLKEIREEADRGALFQNIRKDWTMYRQELHKTFIYIEAEGELLKPEDFARETAVYALKHKLDYETVRLDKTYAIVKLEGIAYQASYTTIAYRFAQMPMVKLTRCRPPEKTVSIWKYIFFSLLPMLLIAGGILFNILGSRYFPGHPRLYHFVTMACFAGAFFLAVSKKNVNYIE